MNPAKLRYSVPVCVSILALFTSVAAAQPKPITACGTTISVPGSYVVTQNLSSASTSVPCIKVTASGVTIDLGGFVLSGIGGSSPGIAAGLGPLSISNGFIRSFFGGISAPVAGVRVRNVTVIGPKGDGALVGDNSEVTDSEFESHSDGDGLIVLKNALVSDCTMVGNFGGLFANGNGTVVTENVASNNGGSLAGNAAGISTEGNATITGNAADSNTNAGFLDGVGGDIFEGDTATGTTEPLNAEGFDTGEQSKSAQILGNNTFIGDSAVGNKFDGFLDAGGSTFVTDTAVGDGGVGFFSPLGAAGTYVDNTADSNNFGFNLLCPSNLVGNTAENNTTTQFAPTNGSTGCNVQINLGF
jgi:hypothetical protein